MDLKLDVENLNLYNPSDKESSLHVHIPIFVD